jgi:hypothetical protein
LAERKTNFGLELKRRKTQQDLAIKDMTTAHEMQSKNVGM